MVAARLAGEAAVPVEVYGVWRTSHVLVEGTRGAWAGTNFGSLEFGACWAMGRNGRECSCRREGARRWDEGRERLYMPQVREGRCTLGIGKVPCLTSWRMGEMREMRG